MHAMSRLHIHLHVRDIAESVRFYSTLLGAPPSREEDGYAKWMLDDPKVNFAISTGQPKGLRHLGIQVENESELAAVSARAEDAAGAVLVERGARCCFAMGNKVWAEDPEGITWEIFHTTGALSERGASVEARFVQGAGERKETGACGCAPKQPVLQSAACCGA
jgi:catechol 2,3-dioxygenase-like lactoylglutathione lyase family enzyme